MVTQDTDPPNGRRKPVPCPGGRRSGRAAVRPQVLAGEPPAVRVCQAAVGGGTLPGAAACLAQVGRNPAGSFRDAPAHVGVLGSALATAPAAPLHAVAANAGEADPAAVADRLTGVRPGSAYDAVSGTFREADTAGVWDCFPAQPDLPRAVGDAAREYLAMVPAAGRPRLTGR